MKHYHVFLPLFISIITVVLFANPDQWHNESVIPIYLYFQNADTHSNGNVDRHRSHHASHHQMPQPDLFSFSAERLTTYFVCNGFTQEQILAQRTLYMSNEFIKVAKGCSGYASAVTALHKKCHAMSGAGKWFRSWVGMYCSGLTRRIDYLYEEIQRDKQATFSAGRAAMQDVEQKQKQEAFYYGDKAQHKISTEAASFARQYGIDTQKLISIHGSPSEQQLCTEFIEILHTTAAMAQRNNVVAKDNLFVNAIGYGADIGITASSTGNVAIARRWTDFCWTVLDCVEVTGEGILLGARNTLHTLAHPLQTAKNMVVGIATVTGALAHAVGIAGECAYLYATDTQQYCMRRDEVVLQLQAIADHTRQKIKTTPSHEIIKQGAAFITEGVLLNKAFTVVHELSTRIIPVAKRALEHITREEALACLVDGEVMAVKMVLPGGTQEFGSTAKVVTQDAKTLLEHVHAKYMNNLQAELATLKLAFDNKIKGVAQLANKFIKVDYEHIMGMKFIWGRECLTKINGFHHDVASLMEKNGLINFVNKVMYQNGFYKADLVCQGTIVKWGGTFFPVEWSREMVATKIYEAYDSFVKSGAPLIAEPNGKFKVQGFIKEGIEIEMYITQKGEILTAYPLLK